MKRLESRIRRWFRAVSATGWAVGVFDADLSLLALCTSSAQLDDRTAITLLSMVPLPVSPPVVLRAASQREATPTALGASAAISDALSVALVLLSKPSERDASEGAETVQRAIDQIAEELAHCTFASGELHSATAPDTPQAFFLLSPELGVRLQWYRQDAASTAVAQLARPENGRLPLFLERAVRRLTISWNLSRIGTCIAGETAPIAGLSLRVVPMQSTETCIGVFLNRYDSGERVDAASSRFQISPREREVLHALFDGNSIAEIADRLGLAQSTVNDHIARMIAKTNARNRIEMAAILLGWPAMKAKRFGNGRSGSIENGSVTGPESGTLPQGRCSWQYDVGSNSSRHNNDHTNTD